MLDKIKIEPKSGKFLLALSGGIDSVVLFDILIKQKINFEAAHCNFQLREDESEGDQQFVETLCKQHRIKLHLIRFETQKYASEKSISTQLAARELRYKWFHELIDEYYFDALLTAHHANDNLESIIYNFAKGTRLAGLRGVAYRTDQLLRPLINVTKEEIRSYAAQHLIKWREDTSNSSDKYTRNLIRHNIVPKLSTINPKIEETATRFANYISHTHDFIQAATKEYFEKIKVQNGYLIPEAELRTTNLVLIETQLYQLGFSHDQLTKLLNQPEIGSKFHSENHELLVERNGFFLRKIEKSNTPTESFSISEAGEYTFDDYRLKIEIVTKTAISFKNKQQVEYFSVSALQFPFTIRQWQDGDRFRPLGMKGYKKVSDFLIDQKIELKAKSNVWVLESNNKIAWLINHRIDDRFKIKPSDKAALKISLEEK